MIIVEVDGQHPRRTRWKGQVPTIWGTARKLSKKKQKTATQKGNHGFKLEAAISSADTYFSETLLKRGPLLLITSAHVVTNLPICVQVVYMYTCIYIYIYVYIYIYIYMYASIVQSDYNLHTSKHNPLDLTL